jgi:hypothetical protein
VAEAVALIVHEADEPNLVAHLFDADALTGEHDTEVDLLPIEADAPACGDGNGLVVERVVEVRQVL